VFSLREVPGLLVTFDYAGDRIVLAGGALPEPDGKTVLAYEAPMGIPVLPITIAGQVFEAHLDTGAPSGISVPLESAETLPLEARPVEAGKARTVNSEMTLYTATLKGNAQLGGFTFENPELTFNDKLPFVNIGSGLLSRFTMTLDRENKRLRLVPNEVEAEKK
jgi:hypothetical protein